MLFQVYGENALFQWLGWAMVFAALILANEFARRSKLGGILCFLALPAALTVYFVAIYVGAAAGAEWALTNPTYVHMNSWFHYAKLYAATAGCIGFMILKYRWGSLGKSHWFRAYPFVIVAINILIAVVSDFESAFRAWGTTWVSSEGVTLMGGWHNVSPADLLIPLDTHMFNISSTLGLCSMKSASGKAAAEITRNFKDVSPETNWISALEHAQKIGVGSMEYDLVEI